MRKIFLSGLILLILVGCDQSSNADWYDTKEEAIAYGLEQEGMDESAVLSVEDYEGETIVFFEKTGSLGVASITENEKGYSWYRNEPYVNFQVEGDIPFTTNGFELETKSGSVVSVLYGKTFDHTINKMKLSGDGAERELEVFEDSQLFYAIHEQAYSSLEISPVTNNES